MRNDTKGYRISLGDNKNVLKLDWWWLHNFLNILKTMELYTLNTWILGYVNYISIKLLNNNKKYITPPHNSLCLPLPSCLFSHCPAPCCHLPDSLTPDSIYSVFINVCPWPSSTIIWLTRSPRTAAPHSPVSSARFLDLEITHDFRSDTVSTIPNYMKHSPVRPTQRSLIEDGNSDIMYMGHAIRLKGELLPLRTMYTALLEKALVVI